MLRRPRLLPVTGPALALALVLGVGLPAVQPVVAPGSTDRAEAAAAGTAFLRPVVNVHSSGADLSWDRYVPVAGETFTQYEVHRSATAGFTPSPATWLTTIRDIDVTTWTDHTAKASTAFSYRLVANSAVSNEVRVTTPAAGKGQLTLQPAGPDGEATYVVRDTITPGTCTDQRNYGSSTTMGIGPDATGWQRRGLVRFDLRSVPAGAAITSAKLTMSYAATTNPNLAVSLHRVRQPWAEGTGTGTCNGSGVTWTQTQNGVGWKSGGTVYDATADATLAAKSRATAGTDAFTITGLVQEWVTGQRPNHGVVIKGTSDGVGTTSPNFTYYSDDYTTTPTKRPKLEVTYDDGSVVSGPRVAVASPEAGARVSGTVPLTATAGDDGSVAKVEFLVGTTVVGTDTSAPYSVSWNASAVSGAQSITARATDDAGNVKTSAARSVTVDNSAAPTVSLSAPAAGATVKGSVTVSATASASTTSVEFYVDDDRVATDSVSPFSATWKTLDVVDTAYDGSHVVTAKAIDAAGRVTTSAARTVTVANTAATPYTAAFDLNEPGSSTAALAIPDTFLDNDLSTSSDPYSGSTSTKTLSSSPSDTSQSYATYNGGMSYSEAMAYEVSYAQANYASMTESAESAQAKTSATTAASSEQMTLSTTDTTSLWYSKVKPPYRDSSTVSPNALKADVTVTNQSSVAWKGGYSGLQLWYRWYVPTEMPKGDGSPGDTGVVLFEGRASSFFPQTLNPGASKVVPVVIEPPRMPEGIDKTQVRLRIDLYDVDSTLADKWYATKGNKPIDQPVVLNREIEGNLGLERFWQYEGDETGAGSATLTNVANGNMMWRWSPFFAPGRGLATMLDLTYNSLEDHSESPAGNNMSLSVSGLTRWGYGLDIHPNRADEIAGRGNKYVTFTDGDGTTHEFTGTTKADGTTKWTEPPGVNLYLRSVPGTDTTRKWALTRPDRTTYFFDDEGYPRYVEDRNGNTLTFTVEPTPAGEDPGGPKMRITKVSDAAGRSFTVDYYSKSEVKKAHVRGNIEWIKDHSGSQLLFEYYDDGNLRRLVQRGGTKANGETLADRSFVFTYTTSNGAGPAIPLAADRVDPNPKTPNQSTRLFSIRDPRGEETNFAYYGPGSGQLRWKLKSRWNRLGDATGACTSANSCTAFSYNISTRRTTVDAPQNRDTDFLYDTTGKVTSFVDPLEQTTTVEWSPDFKVTKVTEPGGAVQTWQYNHNGYLTEHVNGEGEKATLTYLNRALDGDDALGHWSLLRTKTSARGNETTAAGDYTWTFDYGTEEIGNLENAGVDGNMTRATDPEGYTTKYDWNLRGSTSPGTVKAQQDARGKTTSFEYDPSGQPSKITDPEGGITAMGYDVDGQLVWVQDPNHAAEPDPDGNGDAADRRAATYYDYDSFQRLGRQSAPKSTRWDEGTLVWSSSEFDPNDNSVRAVDPHYGGLTSDGESGAVSTASFDAMDQVQDQTNQDDETTAYRWDTAGRIVQVTKPKGVATGTVADDYSAAYTYDDLDRVVTEADYGTSSAQVRRIHMCYDAPGDLRSVTSPRAGLVSPSCPGNGPSTAAFTTTYAYDLAHRQVKKTDPLGHQQRVTYDANGNTQVQEQDIDKAGAPGRVTRTERVFDQRDLPVKVLQRFTASRNLTTVIKYDGNGNKVLVAPPRAVEQANGAALSDQSPFVTSYEYDGVDRPTRITQPFGPAETERQYVHRAYDKNGNLLSTSFPVTTAAAANVADTAKTVMTYWDPSWVRTSDKPANPEVSFDYAAQGWQTRRTPDKKGAPGTPDTSREMFWSFYPDGQLQERRDRDGNPSTYQYDLDNNLTYAIDASGVTGADDDPMETRASWTGFDEVQRAWHRKNKDGTNPWEFSDYTYDANGNVTRRLENGEENSTRTAVTKAPDEHSLSYDQADWLSQQLDRGQTNLDLSSKPTECKDDQRTLNTFWDTGLEKDRKVYRAGATCTGDETSWPLKTRTTWTHFDNGKLKVLETTNGSGAVTTRHDVEYDQPGVTLTGGTQGSRYENGDRTVDRYVLKRADGSALCTSVTDPCKAEYEYDARGKLVHHVRRTLADGTKVEDRYKLDEPAFLRGDTTIRAGNVTTESKAGELDVNKYYDSNQLQELKVAGASASYVYDSYGNVDCVVQGTSPSCGGTLVKDYAYDALDRLAMQKTYGGAGVTDSADYTYDALDRTTKEVETHSGTSRTTDFNHEGLSNRVTEEKQSGTPNAKTKTFSYDAYGHRLSMSSTPNGTTQTETFTYAYDVHGSVSQLIGDGGQVKASYGYDAYGGQDDQLTTTDDPQTDTTTDPLNPYRFQGRRLDSGSATATSEASSVDMGARRYGVDTGRFLQEDMFASALADLGLSLDPLSQNRYALAGGNPVSFVEVDGHMLIADGGGGGSTSPNPTTTTSGSTATSSSDAATTATDDGWSRTLASQADDNPWETSTNISDYVVGPMMAGPQEVGGWGSFAGKAMHSRYGFMRTLGAKFNGSLRQNATMTSIGRFARSPAGTWGGRALGAAGATLSFFKHRSDGDRVVASAAKTGVEFGAALAGAKGGALAGAAIGSVIPGVGTAAGAFVGGIVGGALGALAGSELMDSSLGEGVEDVADSVQDWGEDALESAGDFLGF